MQKNGGYGLEHAFSTDNTAMKNFYVLMQIGHIFNQLLEKGSLLRARIRETMGSLKVFSQMLWAELTHTVVDSDRLRAALARRIQIRFDTSRGRVPFVFRSVLPPPKSFQCLAQ